jgi:chemotaxis protein histidine kinase CheA
MSTVTIQDLTRILMEADPADVGQLLLAMERGMESWSALSGKAVPVLSDIETPVKKVPVAKKAIKKEVVAPSIPTGSGIPTADSYRLTTIDNSVCVARSLKPAGEDKRWKPSVYAEAQCGGKVTDGSDLCAACVKKMEKFAESKTAKSGWNGRLTESPPDYTHMLGTAWAAKCKWIGNDSDSVSVPDSEMSTNNIIPVIPVSVSNVKEEEEPESKPEVTEAVVEMPPKADAAAKKLEAAKAKEEAAAKKLAEAEAKKAAAEAKKAEAAKAKEEAAAKKLAEAEAKKAEKATKKPAAKKTTEAPVPEVKATTTAAPVTVAGELLTVGTDFYWVNNGNVYEYSLVTEQQGDFVGRLRPDGTIDGDAEEVTSAESDSE